MMFQDEVNKPIVRRIALVALISFALLRGGPGVVSNIGHVLYSKSIAEPSIDFESRLRKVENSLKWVGLTQSTSDDPRSHRWASALAAVHAQVSEQFVPSNGGIRWKSVRDVALQGVGDLVLTGFDVPTGAFIFEGEFPIQLHWKAGNREVVFRATAANLVQNGGFEQGVHFIDGPFWPPGFDTVYFYQRSIGQYEVSDIGMEDRSPHHVLCISGDGTRWPGLRTERVSVEAGGIYLIGGWVSGAPGQWEGIRLVPFRGGQDRRDKHLEPHLIPSVQHRGNWTLHAALWRNDGADVEAAELWLTSSGSTSTRCYDSIFFIELPLSEL